MRRATWAAALALCLLASPSRAYESIFDRIGNDPTLSRVFPETDARAEVQEGFLLGIGTERIRHLPDGRLRVERTRNYTRVRDTDSGRIATLPEPWLARSVLTVTRNLRLMASDTWIQFKRSGDGVLPGEKLSERHDWLFNVDHTSLRATADGKHLAYQVFLGGKRVKSENYDYPSDSVPLELIGLLLTVAVQRQLDTFDFDLVVGSDTHGVRAQTFRTRDLRRYAKGYHLPKSRLVASEPQAVVDMRLASPIKYVFFPHHFYMAFSAREPWKLNLLWGGDPDENLQAVRID
jgi:hypothetical protein